MLQVTERMERKREKEKKKRSWINTRLILCVPWKVHNHNRRKSKFILAVGVFDVDDLMI